MASHKFNIAVLIPIEVDFHKEIISSIEKTLEKASAKPFCLTVYNSNGPNYELRKALAKEIISGGFHLAVAIGVTSTKALQEESDSANSDLPIVFCGTGNDPVSNGLISSLSNSQNNLVGVEIETNPRLLPAQLLTSLKPSLKSILIPYHVETKHGLFKHIGQNISNYFKERRIKVYPLPINSPDETYEKAIPFLEKVDSVLFIAGDWVAGSYESIADECRKRNITLFANGSNAVKNGAVFGLKADLKFMGMKVAEHIKAILEKGNRPCDLQTILLPHNVHLSINPDLAQKQGIIMSEEIVGSVEDVYAQLDRAYYKISMFLQRDSNYILNLNRTYMHAIVRGPGAYYHPVLYFTHPNHKEVMGNQIKTALTNQTEMIMITDPGHADQLYDLRKESGNNLPIFWYITVYTLQEAKEMVKTIKSHENTTGMVVVRQQALRSVYALQALNKDIKRIAYIYHAHHTYSDIHHDKLYEYLQIKAYCDRFGIDLVPMRIRNNLDIEDIFEDKLEPMLKKTGTGVITSADHQHRITHIILNDLCLKYKTPLVAGGTLFAADNEVPAGVGIDLDIVVKEKLKLFNELFVKEKKADDIEPVILSNIDRVVFSEEACDKYGVPLSDHMKTLLLCSTVNEDEEEPNVKPDDHRNQEDSVPN